MTHQVALTIVAQVKAGQSQPLKTLLATIHDDVATNALVPFAKLTGIHFARLLVLDETVDLAGQPIPSQLILMSDVDAPLGRHVGELADVAGAGIDAVFGHCEGFPTGSVTPGQRLAYLRAHTVQAATVYVNTIGRTVQQIQQEAQLRDVIEEFIDQHRVGWADHTPASIRAAIQTFVCGEPNVQWARNLPQRPGLFWQVANLIDLIAVPLILLVLLPVILLALPVYAILLRIHEQTDVAKRSAPDEAHLQLLAGREDFGIHNQFSAIGYLKPGLFRLLTATVVLWLGNWATRHVFNRANLAGVTTIHFARWVFLDTKRRLIFASNYDGSLESYMDDFIDKVAWGLNAVFSNGVDYPRTNWLIRDGARDEQAFKLFIRAHQMATDVWFSAYPNRTALNIENNARIREGLFGPMDEAAAAAWLQRF